MLYVVLATVTLNKVVAGTLVMFASTVYKVVKYYHRPKQSSNEIRILETKFEFGKNEFNIPSYATNKIRARTAMYKTLFMDKTKVG